MEITPGGELFGQVFDCLPERLILLGKTETDVFFAFIGIEIEGLGGNRGNFFVDNQFFAKFNIIFVG